VMSEDLAGFQAADKLISSGFSFDRLLPSTADLAGKLHSSGLHHRDLYLCHFFVKAEGDNMQLRLIDAARVRELPRWMKHRWIVKDLAQFWYSATQLGVPDEQLIQWLKRYSAGRTVDDVEKLTANIVQKVNWIARHDLRLKRSQPKRNISIPQPRGT
jgi:Lipopolysaccharide kinase (Kdo/WaaP) family